jgi:hypothetical protein
MKNKSLRKVNSVKICMGTAPKDKIGTAFTTQK